MKFLLFASSAGLLVSVVLASGAIARPPGSTCNGAIAAEAGNQVFNVNAGAGECSDTDETSESPSHGSDLPPGHIVTSTTCGAVPGMGCMGGPRTCPDGTPLSISWYATDDGRMLNVHNNCADGSQTAPAPGPTQADILRAFKQIPLPESTLIIQPPGGATLVNFVTSP